MKLNFSVGRFSVAIESRVSYCIWICSEDSPQSEDNYSAFTLLGAVLKARRLARIYAQLDGDTQNVFIFRSVDGFIDTQKPAFVGSLQVTHRVARWF